MLRHLRCAHAFLSAALLAVFVSHGTALAESSINTTLPVQGVPYSAAPIRQNFQAAANDINALQSLNAGPSAPASPSPGTLWLEQPQNQTLWVLHIWNSNQAEWITLGTIDSLNNLWIAPVGGGLPVSLLADNTTDLGSFPQTVETITGAGPVYSFGTSSPAGILKVLQFAGVTTIEYNATSLITPGAANIVTAAGDMIIAVALGSGNWQVLFFQSAALSVAQGGTGRTSLTVHSVLLGEDTSPVGFAVPGSASYPLLSTGASSDPAFGKLDLAGAGVTGTLGVANGGTGLPTIPAHGLVLGADTSPVTALVPGTTNYPLVSRGSTVDPYYAILTASGGGSGSGSLAAHGVLLGEDAAPFNVAAPGTAGYPLLSTGATADPAFGQLDLAGAGITGVLPIGNLPTDPTFHSVTSTTSVSTVGLTVTGAASMGSTTTTDLDATGNFAVNGTTTLAGTLAVNGAAATLAGTLAVSGTTTLADTLTVNGTTSTFQQNVIVSNAIGESRVRLKTIAGQSAWSEYDTGSLVRWLAGKNNTLETGGDAGSDYDIVAFNDAGASIAIPFRVYRATGAIRMNMMPTTCVGMDPGTLWNNANVVNICP